MQGQSLGQEDPLEKEMAAHSNILDWEVPRREEPGRLQSMRLRRVRHDWETNTTTHRRMERRVSLTEIRILHFYLLWQMNSEHWKRKTKFFSLQVTFIFPPPCLPSSRLWKRNPISAILWGYSISLFVGAYLSQPTQSLVEQWEELLRYPFKEGLISWLQGMWLADGLLLQALSEEAQSFKYGSQSSQSEDRSWIPEKNIYSCFTDYTKASDCLDHNKLWKILKGMGIPDYVSWETCMWIEKQQLEPDMEQLTGSKLGKEYEKRCI